MACSMRCLCCFKARDLSLFVVSSSEFWSKCKATLRPFFVLFQRLYSHFLCISFCYWIYGGVCEVYLVLFIETLWYAEYGSWCRTSACHLPGCGKSCCKSNWQSFHASTGEGSTDSCHSIRMHACAICTIYIYIYLYNWPLTFCYCLAYVRVA